MHFFPAAKVNRTILCKGIQILFTLIVLTYNGHYIHEVFQRHQYIPISQQCGKNFYNYYNVNLKKNYNNFENGSLQAGNLTYHSGAFWLQDGNAYGCPCKFKTCVVKCCPSGHSFTSKSNLTCTKYGNLSTTSVEFNITVYYKLTENQGLNNLKVKQTEPSDFFLFNNTECTRNGDRFGTIYTLPPERMFLTEDGTVLKESLNYLDIGEYCLEIVNGQSTIFLLDCIFYYPAPKINLEIVFVILATVGWHISQICLIVTFLIYLTLPQLQNLHGKLIISYLISLIMLNMCFYIFYFYLNISLYLLYYFLLAIPSWLSVLCVNLWVVFSKPLRPRVQTSAHWWLYTLYSVLGWGIPLLFCFLIAAVGVVPGKSDSCPKPSFTIDACFFNEMRTTQLFLHFPTMFMLQINFLMFVSMLFHMQSHFQQTAGVSRESLHRHNRSVRESISVYIKLTFITGFDWLFIHFTFTNDITTNNGPSELIGISLFCFQGFLLFFVLICNGRVFQLLQQKWCT
ncbi:G-protein coupled receptor Mth-like [Homalodisca vitripennis]|uniref:G-protein coupled receptor Mth-like n=1 Tax=Homalodisca vitripennis TaxID=197043 RepID=UPI001EEAEE1B|nr:G-protein coupled receptor Mth-like [Homalodisca vitripennis]